MTTSDPSDPEYFEAMYREKADPWNFARAAYEQDRFETIAASLRGQHFRHALEPGCSIGTLTERLATLADKVTAFDFSPTAVEQAQRRCALLANVEIACGWLSEETAFAEADLVILSEIGYYLESATWRRVIAHMECDLAPGSTVVAAHWLGQAPHHHQTSDEVHAVLRNAPKLRLTHEARYPLFRLDHFVRVADPVRSGTAQTTA